MGKSVEPVFTVLTFAVSVFEVLTLSSSLSSPRGGLRVLHLRNLFIRFADQGLAGGGFVIRWKTVSVQLPVGFRYFLPL